MYCNHCGAQQPDGSKFCNSCGAQIAVEQPSPAAKPEAPRNQPVLQQETKTEKKKGKLSIWVTLLIVLAAFMIGKFVIAPSMVSDSGKDHDTGNQGGQSQQSTENNGGSSVDSANPAYDAVFDDTYIVHFQTFFNMEMESFALKQGDGVICCADYGYKDDVVKQWVETMYIPVSEYTDAQKTELENTMKTQFAAVDVLNCCTVTYKMSTNYFTVTCTYSDVDKAENYAELYHAQILQTNTFISMSATEDTLLNQGFVKK